ncbi:hypothetical protein AB0C93_19795 [Streptomyces sp. NPDC048518]|uniref:hypothetical protein n=1 Tax=Streptomyces sp. NPDC048518 TaxID=3155029 RepID=UPI0033D1107D
MGSLSTVVTTAAAAAILSIGVPAAQAADSAACGQAKTAAQQAESDYQAALKDYQEIVDDGGHPDQSQRDNVDQLKAKSAALSAQVARACPDTRQQPTGAAHAGTGGTSKESYAPAVAASALVALTGTSILVKRRRSRS